VENAVVSCAVRWTERAHSAPLASAARVATNLRLSMSDGGDDGEADGKRHSKTQHALRGEQKKLCPYPRCCVIHGGSSIFAGLSSSTHRTGPPTT
jgi:hypothetical protein